MLIPTGWQPGTLAVSAPSAPTEEELVIPPQVDVLEVTLVAPVGTESVTPPLLILGWDNDQLAWRELAQITNTDPVTGDQVPFDVGPVNPAPSYLLRGSPGIRRLHIQAAALTGVVATRQRGIYQRSDT